MLESIADRLMWLEDLRFGFETGLLNRELKRISSMAIGVAATTCDACARIASTRHDDARGIERTRPCCRSSG